MNKSFYMASLALLATIAAKQKRTRTGSFSMEELFELANAKMIKSSNEWSRDSDPLNLIKDIDIEITTRKDHFNSFDVGRIKKALSRFTSLKKIKLIINKHFPIHIVDGLRTSPDERFSWYKPANSIQELDFDIRTEGDMPDNYFFVGDRANEFRNLKKVKLKLNSQNIPSSLFHKPLRSLEIILNPLFKGNEKNTVDIEFIDDKLKELSMTVTYDSFRQYYAAARSEIPKHFVALPKSLEKLKSLEELTLHGVIYDESIKKLRKLKSADISNVPLNSNILSAKPEELSVKNAFFLEGDPEIKIPINRKTKFLSLRIWTDSTVLNLSFLSKFVALERLEIHFAWNNTYLKEIILPKDIHKIKDLKALEIQGSGRSGQKLKVHNNFYKLKNLERVDLAYLDISLPSTSEWTKLKEIKLYHCAIGKITNFFSSLTSLKKCQLIYSKSAFPVANQNNPNIDPTLKVDPNSFSGCVNLQYLKMHAMRFDRLPSLDNLVSLRSLFIDGSIGLLDIPFDPEKIKRLTKLRNISIDVSPLPSLNRPLIFPEFIEYLPALKSINIKSSRFVSIGNIHKIKSLKNFKSSKTALKRIQFRPTNYEIVEMITNGFSKEDAIKIMSNSVSTPKTQLRRF